MEYTPSSTNLHHPDNLGSARLVSKFSNRTMFYDVAYAPYSEPYAETGTTDRDFSGVYQENVSGIYDFPEREFSSVQGRWLSPDPVEVDKNRYAYVNNAPLLATDPTGTFTMIDGSQGEWGWSGGWFGGWFDMFAPNVLGWGLMNLNLNAHFENRFASAPTLHVEKLTFDRFGILPGENSINWPDPYPITQRIADALAGKWDKVLGLRIPGYNAPPIMDAHTDDQGYWVGDFSGEVYCDQVSGECLSWDGDTQMWDNPWAPAQQCQHIYNNYVNAVDAQKWKNVTITAGWAGGGCIGGVWGCIGGAGASDINLWGTNWNLDTINLQYANQLRNAGCENIQW